MKYVIVSLFLITVLLAGSGADSANILPNPGFESWIDTNWVQMPLPWLTNALLDPDLAYRSDHAHSGNYSLALAMADSIPGLAWTGVFIQGGTHYDFSMYYDVSSFACGGLIALVEFDVDSGNVGEHLQVLSYTPGWSQVGTSFDAHPSAVLLMITLTSVSETLYFDTGVLDGLPGTGVSEWTARSVSRATPRLVISPNPCRGSARIIASSGELSSSLLEIYDASGRLVRRFERLQGLREIVIWDGKDEDFCPVPSGTYFVKLNTGYKTCYEKLALIR